MANFISLNIKYLCNENKLTQKEFGEIFGLKQNVISSYIKENATPKVETLQQICEYFKITLDDFINNDLSNRVDLDPARHYTDPLIRGGVNEPSGTREVASYAAIIKELRGRIEDKDELIEMLRAENKRLKGNQDYNSKTA